jgi:hypothetical protein
MSAFRLANAAARPAAPGRRTRATWPEIGVPAPAAAEPPPPAAPAPPAMLLFDEADLARALAAVDAEGRALERDAATRREVARLASALEAVAAALAEADAVIDRRTRQFREATTTLAALATETVGRGGGRLAARLAEALVADCLARLDPRLALTIEVAPELADPLAATLAAAPGLEGRPARIAVEPVATLAPGEARLVWQDGEAEWSVRRLHETAADLVRRLTGTDGGAPAPAAAQRQPEATQGADAR